MSENIADLPDWAQKHIRELRAEAAENRQALKDATAERDQLRTTLHEKAAAAALEGVRSLMADPEDLTRFVDAAELVGDDGAPDPAKYEAKAKELIESKPHLAARAAGRSGNAVGGDRGRDFGHPVGGGRSTGQGYDTDAQIAAGQQDFVSVLRGSS
ncbi:hypothetical protein [Rhodococcus sp. Chr-9]|uniref:hypothetical protein n=1 Tax=Rhodococcus sp. Chr-9 TaxID=713612 RepID=UPI0005747F7E|nr:hypothetical protein [Rhodococcus sp. Chr-9]KHJ71352.1 hypothetical protein QR64_18685 [Rhodococcus sp. Chr-9]